MTDIIDTVLAIIFGLTSIIIASVFIDALKAGPKAIRDRRIGKDKP